MHLPFLIFPTTKNLCGIFFFVAYHDVLLCFLLWRKSLHIICANVCGLEYVLRILRTFMYGFCVHVRFLRTYTAYLLHKLWRFCVHIQLLCLLGGFAYVYGLSFALFEADSLEVSNLVGSSINFVRVTLVIRGQSRGSDLEVSIDFFVRAVLLLDIIEDPILRVSSISLSERAARDLLSDLTSEVSCWY